MIATQIAIALRIRFIPIRTIIRRADSSTGCDGRILPCTCSSIDPKLTQRWLAVRAEQDQYVRQALSRPLRGTDQRVGVLRYQRVFVGRTAQLQALGFASTLPWVRLNHVLAFQARCKWVIRPGASRSVT